MPERDCGHEELIRNARHDIKKRNDAEFYTHHFLLRYISRDHIETASDGFQAFQNIAIYYANRELFHKPTVELYEKHFKGKTRAAIEEYFHGICAARFEREYGKPNEQEKEIMRRQMCEILDGKMELLYRKD